MPSNTETNFKKVLFLSYYFPPAGGSAVQRCLKFAKYLPEYGWEPHVLTARAKDIFLRDDSLMDQIPSRVKVYRTPAPDLYGIYSGGGKRAVDLGAISTSKAGKGSWIQKLALWIRRSFFIPDARIGWLPFAFFKGLQIIRKEKIDIIFATSPPFTTALIGHLLSTFSSIPWVSDYRDPWTQAYFYFKRPVLSQWIENKLEKKCLFHANKVISINRIILEGLAKKFSFNNESQWAIIPNGFDPEDFEDITPVKSDKFTITYTGTLNAKMHPLQLLRAVKAFSSENENFKKNICLKFIGRMGSDEKAMFAHYLESYQYQIIGHLPHREALKHTAGSTLLLLLIPETEHPELIVTGKIFEYMRSGRPILGLIPENGEAARIIRETRTGMIVPPENNELLKTNLKKNYALWKSGSDLFEEVRNEEAIQTYSRQTATGILASIFNDVLK